MKQHNIDFLEQNRKCYVEVVGHPAHGRSATLARKIDSELLNILREEFMPGYPAPSDCGDCLFNMVTVLYEKFDAYMATRKPEPVVVAASFPKNDAPPDAFDTIEYNEFLQWKRYKESMSNGNFPSVTKTPVNDPPKGKMKIYEHGGMIYADPGDGSTVSARPETPEERKARLADPNRIIKRRAKRK